jgi:hypothetical protein
MLHRNETCCSAAKLIMHNDSDSFFSFDDSGNESVSYWALFETRHEYFAKLTGPMFSG